MKVVKEQVKSQEQVLGLCLKLVLEGQEVELGFLFMILMKLQLIKLIRSS